jgi:glycosyltransferase involved in cell wall biosynthesis
LRVLLLNSLGIYGGGEFFVLELSSFLKSTGIEVWAGCMKDSPLFSKCMDAGIKTAAFDFPEGGKGKLKKNVKAIKEFILSNDIQIVHTNTNYDRTAGAFAAEMAGAAHIASVHSLQSISHNLTHWTRNKFFVDCFLADGEIVKDVLIKEDKISAEKIFTINLGIDPELFKRDSEKRTKVRNEFQLGNDTVLIGNAGRLVDFKGQEILITAFKKVSENFTSAKLMIVGEGELKEKLQNLTRELGLERNIIFAGFRNDLQAVYSAFDIYAHTPKQGGGELFPFAVLYAMAAGVPVAATGVGEIPNMTADGESGFIVKYDTDEISDKLKLLINDSALRQTMGDKGIKRLKEKFTLQKMGGDILKLYNEIASKRNI